jgi:hypothetical protein
MPSVVIVTEQCYLLAEAINFIIINENEESHRDRDYMLDHPKKRVKKKRQTLAQKNKDIREYIQERKPFHIVINFVPKGSPPNGTAGLSKHSNGDDGSTVNIHVQGLRRSIKMFKDIVYQLREQIPDEKFLDTLVENFLTSAENEENMIDKMELR